MSLSIEHDRAAQLLVARDAELDFEAAQARLERASLAVSYDEPGEAWMQAALLAIVRAGVRMFRGGVYLTSEADARGAISLAPAGGFRGQLLELGAKNGPPPAHALPLHVGVSGAGGGLACWAEGWSGCVAPRPDAAPKAANVLGGVIAGALGLAEAFRVSALGDLRAGRRMKRLSAWGPSEPPAPMRYLPSEAWLLGLGNLGQATLFVLGLLPYANGGDLSLVLQDLDRAGPENLMVQILTEPHWIGRTKARSAAAWAESRGMRTRIVETAFTSLTRPGPDDPRLLLAGVDNLDARRWAAEAGFALVVDAGLGATAGDAFDLRLHSFPGARTAAEAWPAVSEPNTPPKLNSALEKAVAEGRLDRCGALTIAGKSVGVPCTALAAAAIQVGQACRALATDVCCDLVDASLADSGDATAHLMPAELTGLAFTASLDVSA